MNEEILEQHNSKEEFNDNIEYPESIISIRSDANESDINEKEFTKISIHSEMFINNLNLLFHILFAYGVALLLLLIIGTGFYKYNFFPFDIQKISSWITQVGYIVFLASYWTSNVILLRILIIIGYIFFTISAFVTNIIPNMDTLLWTYIFVTINLKQIIKLFYDKRPIVFDSFREKIYVNMFDGIMSRVDFKSLTKNSLLRDLSKDRFYCQSGDRCSNLSILVYGKMKVNSSFNHNSSNDLYDNEKTIYIKEDEFIDSPQWMLRHNKKKGKRFTYSIQACTDCKYLTWSREFLIELLEKNINLEQPLLGALGLDVSHKVLGDYDF